MFGIQINDYLRYYFYMSEFTPSDRDKLVETHTLVKRYAKVLDDHEDRIRKTEKIATKATVYGTLGGTIFVAFLAPMFKKLFGS